MKPRIVRSEVRPGVWEWSVHHEASAPALRYHRVWGEAWAFCIRRNLEERRDRALRTARSRDEREAPEPPVRVKLGDSGRPYEIQRVPTKE